MTSRSRRGDRDPRSDPTVWAAGRSAPAMRFGAGDAFGAGAAREIPAASRDLGLPRARRDDGPARGAARHVRRAAGRELRPEAFGAMLLSARAGGFRAGEEHALSER